MDKIRRESSLKLEQNKLAEGEIDDLRDENKMLREKLTSLE